MEGRSLHYGRRFAAGKAQIGAAGAFREARRGVRIAPGNQRSGTARGYISAAQGGIFSEGREKSRQTAETSGEVLFGMPQ